MRTTLDMRFVLLAVAQLTHIGTRHWADTLYPLRGTCIAWNEL